ncbi:hypothetical protein PMAYCL1PPCAC_27512 [Pristionchus mayeri]|uniref:STAS domain-containing protein n=1 Tax=Pristionchus mayeri TaxID=1317129 RepID=A0AAN5IC46_9BILA|nr:hypothetical protein PMAYCL1PPCAC_27511 [Pristionchus mayeri]GMR57317.1 hypothetical protein PMAYCL1PPCAC_27512 [Pristionchus mayeri]
MPEPAEIPESSEVKEEEVTADAQPRSASEELSTPDDKNLRPLQKDRSNSHCCGSPISTLLNKLTFRRQSSYDLRQAESGTSSSSPGLLASTHDGVSRAARKSIHSISHAFSSLRGKNEAGEEAIYVHNFVSPTLFLYGKDLQQAASKKLAEWEKYDSPRTKEGNEEYEAPTRHFIVDCSAFIFLDNAGAASMAQTYRDMSVRNVKVYYAAARDSVRSFFHDLDESERVPPSAFYPTVDFATQLAKAYKESALPHITISGLPMEAEEEHPDDDLGKQELNIDEPETVGPN